jgi:transposase
MGTHPSQAERDEIVKLHAEKGYSTRLLASTTRFSRGAILNWIRANKASEKNFIKLKQKRLSRKRSDARTIKALRAEVEVLRSFMAAYERWAARG